MSCGSFIRGRDSFGASVSPTHKGHRYHHTIVGGCVTILVVLILVAYLITGAILVSGRQYNASVQQSYDF